MRGWRMAEHAHADVCEMIVPAAGKMAVRIRGEVLLGGPGTVFRYPTGTPHEEWAIGDRPLETFYFGFREADGPGTVGPILGVDAEGRILMLARWMRELFPPRDDEARRFLDLLLAAILREFRSPPRTGDHVVRATERHVSANLNTRLRLDDLAAAVGLSKYHYARLFKAEAGETPLAFVRRKRVEAARTLLLTTPMPLKVIAAQTGFADEYSLSRTYKRIAGESPRSARRRAAGADRVNAEAG
ncbi:MAG: AraC family transcriptional regulator [Planctomycetota bacterium]|nr:AraC family transcriptional regulator [Planctomycetota bacterium]